MLFRHSVMNPIAAFIHEMEAALYKIRKCLWLWWMCKMLSILCCIDSCFSEWHSKNDYMSCYSSLTIFSLNAEFRFSWRELSQQHIRCNVSYHRGFFYHQYYFFLYLTELLWQNLKLHFNYINDLNIWWVSHSLNNNITFLNQNIQSILRWEEINKMIFTSEKFEMIYYKKAVQKAVQWSISDNCVWEFHHSLYHCLSWIEVSILLIECTFW